MQTKLLKIVIIVLGVLTLMPGVVNTKLLLGKWECQTDEGRILLEFLSEKQLVYDGETISCKIKPGLIQVAEDEMTWVDYPYTLKVGVLTITYPEGYQLRFTKVKAISKGKTTAAGTSKLVAHFAGTWKNYTGNTETMAVLEPNGDFYERYTSSYSGGGYGPDGQWGAASDKHGRGRWTVKGNLQQGTITLTYPDGSVTAIRYQVHVENGQTYWREYYFNGDLYGKE